jgi:hypothetical protein
MWQCSGQSPGASATNSIVRVVPTGTSTVVSGNRAARRDRAAVGLDDLEGVAVDVDRVVIHRAEVGEPDAHEVAELGDERRGRRERLAVEREHVEVVHRERIGRRVPIGIFHSWASARSRGRGGARRPRGCTTIMPIMPSAIWVISSACG